MNYNDTNAISAYAEITAKQYKRDIEYIKNFMISRAQTAIKELADMISNLQEQEFNYKMYEIAEMFRDIEAGARYGGESMLLGAQAQSFEYVFKERKGHE